MTDEEYVRSVWEKSARFVYDSPDYGVIEVVGNRYRIYIPPHNNIWAAAAEYTRTREEEKRQLREEIQHVQRFVNGNLQGVKRHGDSLGTRHLCSWSRILARLESALADLTRGMKPTP